MRGFDFPLLGAIAIAFAPLWPAAGFAAPVLNQPIDGTATITLTGDLSGAVRTARDDGVLPDATPLGHIMLALKRPDSLQNKLDQLVRDQQTKGSPLYHHWLKPGDLRAYGPDQGDIDKISAWLGSQGLTVNSVSRSGMAIDFGGTAGQVAAAFHTTLHYVSLGGEAHLANITAPAIPQALAPAITGVTLHNFFPKPALSRRPTPAHTGNDGYGENYDVAPADFATIYNVNPLRGTNNAYGGPITGKGITLAVVEQTKMLAFDWNTFRSKFGLAGYAGTLTQIHPGGCTDPQFTGDEVEAAIDAEWSSAVAPDAAIIEASCAGEAPFYFGVEIALQNLVEDGTTATIFSISYEGDEIYDGYSFLQSWTNLVEEGAAEGIAIFVAAGDNGTSAVRNNIDNQGLFVNGLADSQDVVSVGGTDFLDTSRGELGTYWHAQNTTSGGSARSYVPEMTWNNSCASSITYKTLGFSSASQSCNASTIPVVPNGPFFEQTGVGGSGSQSLYYTKPYWQSTSVPGVPNDGVRDQPDVSLFASNGNWYHAYLECMSDANEGGVPCDYNNPYDLGYSEYGGTSFGAPEFAGIYALIQQTFGGSLMGNPAPGLYQLAQAQFTTPLGLTTCDASLGNKISAACVFNNVTAGNNSQPCYGGTPNCRALATAADGIGYLVNPAFSRGPAYHAGVGYNLATGLGSVNVTNLLYAYYP